MVRVNVKELQRVLGVSPRHIPARLRELGFSGFRFGAYGGAICEFPLEAQEALDRLEETVKAQQGIFGGDK